MKYNLINNFPKHLMGYAAAAIEVCKKEIDILGLLCAGSAINMTLDQWSDLDLIVVVKSESAYRDKRVKFSEKLGELLSNFTGEHVHEPKLLICLYNNPVAHVDIKFVEVGELLDRVETPVILWQHNNILGEVLDAGDARWPHNDFEWFDKRFWIWVHYCFMKVSRGELFEALSALALIREQVLGPLIATVEGSPQRGLRHIETVGFQYSEDLKKTLAINTKEDIHRSLKSCVELYERLTRLNESHNGKLRTVVKDFCNLGSI